MEITRRKTLASGSATTLAALAGCAAITGTEPRVLDTDTSQGIRDAISGDTTIHVLVENEGPTGDVEVIVEFQDSNRNTIGEESSVVEIEEGEQRRVDFNVSPPRGAERYRATAESADGLL